MSLVLLGCADQLIFYFYVVKYNSLDPLCSTIFHCALVVWAEQRACTVHLIFAQSSQKGIKCTKAKETYCG